MSKLLSITNELTLPLDIITMRTTEYGDSGSGKTAFARLMAEKVHEAHHRFCAIDLKNDWWGLKSSADGESAGIPVVVFGGPRGDVKLFEDTAAAEALAETVASIEQSVILDLDALSRIKQERFLAAFLSHLYDVNRRPMLMMCDEADRYAPQKPMTPDAIHSLSASEDICRRGRKRGLGQFWTTQRTAVLNKNISDLCNMTVIFRTPGSRDLDELQDRVGRVADKETVREVMKLAPGLEDGQAFFLSSHPKLRKYLPTPVRPIQLPMPWTYDSSATPGVGQRRREPKVLAKTDLVAIESKMAQQVERAKANDPKELQKQIAELQRQLKTAQQTLPTPAKAETKTVEKLIITDKQILRLEQATAKVEPAIAAANNLLSDLQGKMTTAKQLSDQVGSMVTEIRQAVQAAKAPATTPTTTNRPALAAAARPRPVQPPRVAAGAATQGEAAGVGSAHLKILNSLAWWETVGVTVVEKQAVAVIAGYTVNGHFNNLVGSLRSSGLIDYPEGGKMAFTEAGRGLATFPDQPGTLTGLHYFWRQKLSAAQWKLVEQIIGAHPTALPAEELAARAGYTVNGHFNNLVGSLRSLGVFTKKQPIAATSLLFPDALISAGR